MTHLTLKASRTTTEDGSEYITAIFNPNTGKEIHIICVYHDHSCQVSTLL
jgi:hypothetical protein